MFGFNWRAVPGVPSLIPDQLTASPPSYFNLLFPGRIQPLGKSLVGLIAAPAPAVVNVPHPGTLQQMPVADDCCSPDMELSPAMTALYSAAGGSA